MARGLNVFVQIGARVSSSVGSATSQTVRQFGAMNNRLRVMAAETSAHMASADRRWGSIRRNGQDFAMGVSVPMAMMASLGAKTAYEWAQVGNNLQAVTLMTEEQRKAVERAARSQIGSPVDNLRAGLDLGRTGLTPGEIAAGLPIAVKLARSDPESVDQAQAADIVTNVIKGMKMPISELGRAADVIGYAAAQSSSDVRLMGESFKYAGPLAVRAGTSIEEAASAFMTMADAGIKGSESGVAFRSMLVRMIKLPKPAAAVLARYNMQIQDYVTLTSKPTGQGIVDSLKASGIAASGAASALDRILASDLTGADLVAALTNAVSQGIEGGADAVDRELLSTVISDALIGSADKIDWRKFIKDAQAKGFTTGDIVNFFDTRQGARLATLFGPDMEDNLAKMKSAAGSEGFLNKMFAMQNQGVVGSMQRLAQSVGNLVIVISESGVIDTASKFIDGLAKSISALGKTNPALLKFGVYAVGFLAILGPIGFLLGGVASGFRALGWGIQVMWKMGGSVLSRLGPMIARLRGSLGLLRLIFTAGGWGAIGALSVPILAIGAGIIALGAAIAWVVAKRAGFAAFFRGMNQGFIEALGAENLGRLIRFGQTLRNVVGIMLTPIRLLAGAVAGVFGWIGRLFAPAETEKWYPGGRAFGSAIGEMVNGLIGFIDKIDSAIRKTREFFSAQGPALGGFGAASGLTPQFDGGARLRNNLAGKPATRQRGGTGQRGSTYEINERGQELFAPGRTGTIIPAAATAALIAAMTTGVPMQAAAEPSGPVTVIVQGAGDPNAVADAVIRKLEKRAGSSARAGMHD